MSGDRAIFRPIVEGGRPQRLPRKAERPVPPCLGSSKILQGGRSHSQSNIFPVGRVEPETVFRHFTVDFALLSFEMLFWKPGTSKELDLEQKLTWQKLGKAPKIGF